MWIFEFLEEVFSLMKKRAEKMMPKMAEAPTFCAFAFLFRKSNQ
jgi:hypothetical protein